MGSCSREAGRAREVESQIDLLAHILLYSTETARPRFEDRRTQLEHQGHTCEWRSAEDWTDEIERCDQVLVQAGCEQIRLAYLAHHIAAGLLQEASGQPASQLTGQSSPWPGPETPAPNKQRKPTT